MDDNDETQIDKQKEVEMGAINIANDGALVDDDGKPKRTGIYIHQIIVIT